RPGAERGELSVSVVSRRLVFARRSSAPLSLFSCAARTVARRDGILDLSNKFFLKGSQRARASSEFEKAALGASYRALALSAEHPAHSTSRLSDERAWQRGYYDCGREEEVSPR